MRHYNLYSTKMPKLLIFIHLFTISYATHDPSLYRMTITSNSIYSLEPCNFDSSSSSAIIMKYDYSFDPTMSNEIEKWANMYDLYLKKPYNYTRSSGPLGISGPLGPSGTLGSFGSIPNRFIGTTPSNSQLSYFNNWCSATLTSSDSSCVYGSYGPLGESGALNTYSYYNTMYHLNELVYWYGDYNINLDSAGVWGIQGPLGPTGVLGVLGALGPLGISRQPGVTTTSDGLYTVLDASTNNQVTIRKTKPMRYLHDASLYYIFDLYEMYSKAYALKLGQTNDCSFGVDAYGQNPSAAGDVYYFTSSYRQFVSLNVVPGTTDSESVYTLLLECKSSTGSSFRDIAEATSNAYVSGGGLANFMVTRLRAGEQCRVTVKLVVMNSSEISKGYYLYVTGSGFQTMTSGGIYNVDPDVFGARPQKDGSKAFNINGPHQKWVKY